LTARPEVRHRRRWEEQRATAGGASWDEVVAELDGRDRRDAERAESPLACDESYTVIDTSELSADDVVERIARAVESR
jgi:cytidylate kinase